MSDLLRRLSSIVTEARWIADHALGIASPESYPEPFGRWVRVRNGITGKAYRGYGRSIVVEADGWPWNGWTVHQTDPRRHDRTSRIELTDGPIPREDALRFAEWYMTDLSCHRPHVGTHPDWIKRSIEKRLDELGHGTDVTDE